jgi:hypothetical protein
MPLIGTLSETLSVFMLSVAFLLLYAKCRYAECRGAVIYKKNLTWT